MKPLYFLSRGVHSIIPKAIFEDGTGGTLKRRRTLAAMDEADIHVALDNSTVHWGYFSKTESPIATIDSGSELTVEMATHHACDDWDKMVRTCFDPPVPVARSSSLLLNLQLSDYPW